MEKLPSLGTNIPQIVPPTFAAYGPLLATRAHHIRSTQRDTYDYGPHPRHQLDIYTPSASSHSVAKNPNSVLVFLYGGGFARGEKSMKDFQDGLIYSNFGHYFAENLGMKILIPDYRLLSHGAQFPSGGEDLALVLDWITERFASESSSPLDIYLMGSSAGGVHVLTYLLAKETGESRRKIFNGGFSSARLKGVVLHSVPLHFQQPDPSRKKELELYFGSDIAQNCPHGLLKNSRRDYSPMKLLDVPILVLIGTLDSKDEILDPTDDFVKTWSELGKTSKLNVQTLQGHNHISPILSVGTGLPTEEAWGTKVIEFISNSSRD